MKTTLDIHDELLARAKASHPDDGPAAARLVEDGLRELLAKPPSRQRYRLADWSAGDATATDPLEAFSGRDLRRLIYGETEEQ